MEENSKQINPYRILGKLHNEGMDYVIERILNKDIRDVSIEEIVEIVSEYLLTIYKENSRIEVAINFEVISKVLNKYKQLPLEEILTLSDISLSDETKSYLQQLDNLDLEKPENALNVMKEIESKVLNSNLPDSEQEYTLIFIAIAEASILYMQNEKAKTNSLWSKFTYQLKVFPWKSDGKGAVGGVITGAIKGSIGGPVSIAIAGGLGALGGAIGSSVQAIIFPSKENKRDFEAENREREERLKKARESGKKIKLKFKPNDAQE